MALAIDIVSDPSSNQVRQILPGDIIVTNESVPVANTSTALTVTGALLLQSIFLANPGGAATYTLDTAANILAAIAPNFAYNQNASTPGGQLVYNGIQNGMSWRQRIVNASANAITIASTANTGVTVNRGLVAASVSRDILITVNAGMQAQTYNVGSTNASAVLTGLTAAQCASLTIGMIVTNAALGLQGQTIIAVNQASGTVTMSGNANATATSTSLTFSPRITIDGL